MQIVIEIPDDFYERVNKDGCMSYTAAEVVVDAFYRGVVLPKGHGDLKDADEVFAVMERNFDMQDLYLPIHFKQFALDEAQTIVEADKEGAE